MNNIDFAIWSLACHLYSRPIERQFLRTLHHRPILATIASALSAYFGAAVRLSSSWIDRQPQAHPLSKNFPSCELGDLLIVTRVVVGNSKPRRVGWILQGKRSPTLSLSAAGGSSTSHEIELYEDHSNWVFHVLNGKSRLGTYNLVGDVAISPACSAMARATHWHYLLFSECAAYPRTFQASTPVQWLWSTRGPVSVGSFGAALLDMIQPSPPIKGVELDATRNPEWTRLCDDLIALTKTKPNARLPGGPWHHEVVMLNWGPEAERCVANTDGGGADGTAPPDTQSDGEGSGMPTLLVDVYVPQLDEASLL